jgi:hypothetical protein
MVAARSKQYGIPWVQVIAVACRLAEFLIGQRATDLPQQALDHVARRIHIRLLWPTTILRVAAQSEHKELGSETLPVQTVSGERDVRNHGIYCVDQTSNARTGPPWSVGDGANL